MGDARIQTLLARIADFFSDPKYSDVEIRCEGKSFKVHRNVVCSLSKVLAKECDGEFQEAETHVIEHHMFDAGTLGRMLEFMYIGLYNVCPAQIDLESSMSNSSTLVAHAHVYAIAEYYDVAGLKTVSMENFKAAAENFQVEHLIDVVEAIYDTTPPTDLGLRAALSTLTVDHLDTLLSDGNFITALTDRSGMQTYTIDILCAVAQRNHDLSEKYRKDTSEASVNATQLAEKLSTMQNEKMVLEEELKLKTRVLERAVKLTNRLHSCKNCRNSFTVRLEREFQSGRSYNKGDFYCISCTQCRADHTYAEFCE